MRHTNHDSLFSGETIFNKHSCGVNKVRFCEILLKNINMVDQ